MGGILIVVFGLLGFFGSAFLVFSPLGFLSGVVFSLAQIVIGVICIIGSKFVSSLVWAIILLVFGIIAGSIGGTIARIYGSWPEFASGHEVKSNDKDRELSKNLPLLRCECGAEILLLPDLRVMNHAIEVHVLEHNKKEKDPRKAAETASHIRQILIEQLLRKASEIGK
jgi:ABC-type transport system involved in multi-copper enzyme maturation permease subunit